MLFKRKRVDPESIQRNTNQSANYETNIGTAAGWMFMSIIIGFCLILLGFITNSWHNSGSTFSGIWMACQFEPTTISRFHMDLIKATFILALICYTLAMVFLLLFFFTEMECISMKALLIFYLISLTVFVLMTIAGSAIFGYLVKVNMSWSFAFEVMAAFFAFISAVITSITLSQFDEFF